MRRKTTSVEIGNRTISSDHPILVQSMLNTSTMDTEACVEQAIRIIEAGGELVRITAPGVKDAENLKYIHKALRERGYDTPLSADIHFISDAALVAAQYVEKVRINPGNFVDRRATFQELNYSDEAYAAELEVLKKKFTEFLDICRQYGTAVRIGTNHGSLSDRIMSRYGDTPAGMVEATLEYLRVCQSEHFDHVVISLKSSDCRLMVEAVRLLAKKMNSEGMEYPLHLGVTEAGEGEDGRIRSAIGIGTLLNEGIGDTIRVSLTEAPEKEIPVARALVGICSQPKFEKSGDLLQGDCSRPIIVADLSSLDVMDEAVSRKLGFEMGQVNDPVYGDRLHLGHKSPEMIYTETLGPELTKLPEETLVIVPLSLWDMAHVYNRNTGVLCDVEEFLGGVKLEKTVPVFVQISDKYDLDVSLAKQLKKESDATIVFSFGLNYHDYHDAYRQMESLGLKNQTLLFVEMGGMDKESVTLEIAARVGGLFLNRLPGGLWIRTTEIPEFEYALELSRNILQSAGVRRYKTEFISCPGCGRTLFDLEGTVSKVKQAFGHLQQMKIAVMGCIVNGPGEMGDADYGYIGAGNGKVNLYKGRALMYAAIPEEQAIEQLRVLIAETSSVDV